MNKTLSSESEQGIVAKSWKPSSWQPSSWQQFPVRQMPEYADKKRLEQTVSWLEKQTPLVFAGEIRQLHEYLASVAAGEAFALQGGDCAESFDEYSANNIRDFLKLFLQMSVVLTYGASVPVVKIGRIAGQFAKPRSSDIETINGQSLPSYRGDIINGLEFTVKSRCPDPERMRLAYHQAAPTLNLLRALTTGGFAALNQIHAWNLEFISNASWADDYEEIAGRIDDALGFMKACGVNIANARSLSEVDFFTSHECLLLPYEQALTRQDSLTGKWYDCSAHFLWIGDRTRRKDEGHVEFLRGVENPLGIKVGPDVDLDELIHILDVLNKDNVPGRITLISRFGHEKIGDFLPSIMRRIGQEGKVVGWFCDPMHGNTVKSSSGYKTRPFDYIVSELQQFFDICCAESTVPGGLHFEMTGKNVTECTGGGAKLTSEDLLNRYHTVCDPRLNAEQSLEIAFQIYETLKRRFRPLSSKRSL